MKLDHLLEKCNNFSHFIPANENDIAFVEHSLGISFPEDYRHFLLNYGTAELDSEEIFGLGCPETGYPNVVFIIKQLKLLSLYPCDGLIPIYTNGFGDYYYLVCTDKMKEKRGSVIVMDGKATTVIAESFTDFIKQLIDNIS